MEAITYWLRWLCRRKTCEDLYQDQRSEKYLENRPMIIARADFNEGEMYLTADNIKKRVETINQHLGQFHSYEISSDFVFDQPSMIQHYNDHQGDFKMILQKDKSRVYVELDHRYIGGSMIGWVTYLINQTPQKDRFYDSRWYHFFAAVKLWWNRNLIPKISYSLPLVEIDSKIRRYRYDYSFCRDVNVKATIIHDTMKELYVCLKLDRPLVCYVPIAFNPTDTVCNNVGVMWLTYDPSHTVESVQRQLSENAYQALATNFLLNRGWTRQNQGSSVRKNVDAVLTIIFSEDDHFARKMWTFRNVSEYPAYVSISSVLSPKENCVTVTRTFTVCTPAFDIHQSELSYQTLKLQDFLISD